MLVEWRENSNDDDFIYLWVGGRFAVMYWVGCISGAYRASSRRQITEFQSLEKAKAYVESMYWLEN